MDIFEARIDSFTSQVENLTLVKGSFAEKLGEMINEEFDEIKEREMRKCNVVLSNIPEQTGQEETVETTVNITDTEYIGRDISESSVFSKLLQKGYKKPSRRSASSCAEKKQKKNKTLNTYNTNRKTKQNKNKKNNNNNKKKLN